MNNDQTNYVCCHHYDGDRFMGISSDEQCNERAIEGGYIYCEKHFILHHHEHHNSRLDSGPGLPWGRFWQSELYTLEVGE